MRLKGAKAGAHLAGLLLAIFTGLTAGARAQAEDLADAKDHPLLKRFAGSEIVAYDRKRFDEYDLQTSTFTVTNNHKHEYTKPPLHLEGAITRIWYESKGDTTSTELARNYITELKARGFEVLYNSAEDPAAKSFNGYLIPYGDLGLRTNRSGYVFYAGNERSLHVVCAKLPRPQGDVYVKVTTVQWDHDDATFRAKRGAYAAVDVVEMQPMTQNMVTVSADEMSRAMKASGRVALYGIYFGTDKADIMPKSKAALDEIGKLMKKEPALKLRVVGHTDSAGGMETNMTLSRRRAESVTAALVKDYGIDPRRLTSHGVSSLAPTASNTSDDGRAKNRRVELIPW
jgi:OOP family OmpA-OmpF porin